MAVTADGASNNKSFTNSFFNYCHDKDILLPNETNSRIFCFSHVLNLSVQALLKQIKSQAEDGSDDESDDECEEQPKNYTILTKVC